MNTKISPHRISFYPPTKSAHSIKICPDTNSIYKKKKCTQKQQTQTDRRISPFDIAMHTYLQTDRQTDRGRQRDKDLFNAQEQYTKKSILSAAWPFQFVGKGK